MKGLIFGHNPDLDPTSETMVKDILAYDQQIVQRKALTFGLFPLLSNTILQSEPLLL